MRFGMRRMEGAGFEWISMRSSLLLPMVLVTSQGTYEREVMSCQFLDAFVESLAGC